MTSFWCSVLLAVLYDVLKRHDFMPRITEDEASPSPTVHACNCPFPATVRATRIPCELERAFMSEAVGRPATLRTMSEARPSCTFAFGPAPR